MSDLTSRLAVFSIRHKLVVVLLLVAISGLSIMGYVDPNFWKSVDQVVVDEEDSGQASATEAGGARPTVNPISFSGSDAVLVVQSDNLFSVQAVEALRKVAEDLEALDQVESVLWMDRVPIMNIFGLPQPLLPRATASEKRFEEAKAKAMQHPLVHGQLLSDDASSQLMLIKFNYFFVFSDADVTNAIRETAEKSASQFSDANLSFSVTGRVPSAIAAIEAHEANLVKYQLIGYSMILIMALILFRGIRAVIIVAMAPLIGVFWTMGMIRYLDYSDNPLIDVILPILVSLVGLTDGVHLMVQIRKLRASGLSQQQAAEVGLTQVGLACFLTSLTTAIGFGSLMLADSRWVQQFGLCSTIGVVLCFVSVVTVIPLACNSWLGNNVHVGHEHGLIDRHLNRIGGLIVWVLRHKRSVAATGVLSSLFLGAVALTLKPDQRQSDGLPEKAEATRALKHVDRAFGGLEFSEVAISWGPRVESNSAEVLEVVTQVDDLLTAEELIGHPLSIRNLIDAQPGSGPLAERVTLLELLPPPLKLAFHKPEERQAKVTFRVQDLGIAAYGEVFRRIESGLEKIAAEHPNFSLELAGGAVWRWRNLYQIVVDLAASLGTASIIILIVLAVVFRSLRLGLISIIPNLFPLAFTGAYLAFAGYNLEIVMVCNFTVCLGIAVDDTIHFMTRFLEERHKTPDVEEAIQRAFTGVGTALIMTTAVLVAGFAIVTLSEARDHFIFATMGALTIAAALFCDLIFLPALLAVFGGKQEKPFTW